MALRQRAQIPFPFIERDVEAARDGACSAFCFRPHLRFDGARADQIKKRAQQQQRRGAANKEYGEGFMSDAHKGAIKGKFREVCLDPENCKGRETRRLSQTKINRRRC